MWRGELVGSTVHMKFWRYAAGEVPRDDAGLGRWIYQRWSELDTWIDNISKPSAIRSAMQLPSRATNRTDQAARLVASLVSRRWN